MSTIKEKVVKTRNFVSKHRVALAVTATALVALRLQMRTASEFNKFLKEHDLFDEYYSMDDDVEELIS